MCKSNRTFGSMLTLALLSSISPFWASKALAATNQFRGVNWADSRDNFQSGVLYISGLSSADTYASALATGNSVMSQFVSKLGANAVRMPINEATVSTYWSTYTGAIDAVLSKGLVVLGYWDSAKSNKPADMNAFWTMWKTVAAANGGAGHVASSTTEPSVVGSSDSSGSSCTIGRAPSAGFGGLTVLLGVLGLSARRRSRRQAREWLGDRESTTMKETDKLRLRVGVAFWAVVGLVLALSCSATSGSSGVQGSNNSASGGAASIGSSTGSQAGYVISDASGNIGGQTSTLDGEAVPCTNGDDCICPTLSVAVIGTRGQWGAQSNSSGLDSDTAFQDWLNSSSAGTARVDNYATKPTLTPDFLAGYNVIILAGLGDNSDTGPWWTFDATSEIPAVADWVRKGGGLISLSGYSGDPGESTAKNALLAFAGISYNSDRVGPPCPADYRICGCSAGAAPITDWNQTDPVIAKLSLGVSMIGEVGGHSINAPTNAHVAATTTSGTSVYNLLVGEVVEQGRVLAYSDEWITYTSQWTGVGNPSSSDPSCAGYLPQDRFQTAQFWYNMIRWSQPNATCFKIVDQKQPVMIW